MLLIFAQNKRKRQLVMELLKKMTNQGRNVTQTMITSPETSSIVISGTTSSEKLEGSDRDKTGRARKISREDQTVDHISPQSVDHISLQSVVDHISLQSVENVAQDASQGGVDNFALANDTN